ncbi:TPA: PapB/FocB family fimbrial expression transcriptional regulator [Salmonella enterica subsp. enterica serovar Bahrenfeld]|nr:transcriptional regulator [Salmonella enterica]HAR9007103.1 transcriptional regulator [Salmonella enterica]HAR9319151.1 transcriptional regulator [Salmonella enterica]
MRNNNSESAYGGSLPYELIAGKVDLVYFKLLISISSVTNYKMRKTLEDILVHGISRKLACIKNNVSQSSVSLKIQHLQYVNQTVHMMHQYYKHKELKN